MGIFNKIFNRNRINNDIITIVSGLPRSGTSMMMKMLEAGGIMPLIDNIRTPDKDNPKGYYELERVKQLGKDNKWVYKARGKVIKVISMLLDYLPCNYHYKIIFMQRNMDEILASQQTMLKRKGKKTDKVKNDEIADKFFKHLKKTETWLAQQANMDVLYVNYNTIITNPHDNLIEINKFLKRDLNIKKMVDVIDPELYRHKTE